MRREYRHGECVLRGWKPQRRGTSSPRPSGRSVVEELVGSIDKRAIAKKCFRQRLGLVAGTPTPDLHEMPYTATRARYEAFSDMLREQRGPNNYI